MLIKLFTLSIHYNFIVNLVSIIQQLGNIFLLKYLTVFVFHLIQKQNFLSKKISKPIKTKII